jgi:hypothetical protein
MPPVQETYLDEMPVAYAGSLANQEPCVLISRTVEDEDGVNFGAAVAQGTLDRDCKPFGSGDTAILGIAVREQSANPATPNAFGQYDTARIITKGVVWVTASVAVDAGDPVYVIPATGAFAKTNASSAVLIANARWDSSTAGEGLAKVRLS